MRRDSTTHCFPLKGRQVADLERELDDIGLKKGESYWPGLRYQTLLRQGLVELKFATARGMLKAKLRW